MHYSRTLVLVLAGLGLASPSPSPVSLLIPDARIDPSLKLTDHTAHIDLANFEERADGLSERSLEKRRNVDICTAGPSQDANCIAIADVLQDIALRIARLTKQDSNDGDCTPHTGSFDGVTWKVHASGVNCDNSAQLNTIQGAVMKYLKSQGQQVCGVHCLKLSHGGTYNGYVTIAPAGTSLDNFYCGQDYSFGNCVSGGKNDIPG